jgi:cytochrome c oxidase accessory protein FixG
MERKIEGDRAKQIKLDQAPWTAKKIFLKSSKHTVWIIFSLFTGLTFVGYFTPIRELMAAITTLQFGPWETFWILFYGFATYGNAGWLREQVCIYMCPYARFQSAMFDENTLIISYDEKRGEPRGSRKRGTDAKEKGLGDCIDCTLCVQVCPTGIDIRDGLQYQCIGCAACIDVCDDVMDKMQSPKGLISYTTEKGGKVTLKSLLRPRIIIYTVILLVALSGLFYALNSRIPLNVDIIRDRQTLYRETPDGKIQNLYTLKILNMDEKDHRYSIKAKGLEKMEVLSKVKLISVPAGGVVQHTIRINVDPYHLSQTSHDIKFTVQAEDNKALKVTKPHVFISPQ